MLDKSPEQILDNNLIHIQNEFGQNNTNIVLCSEPFHKAEFLNRLINVIKEPVIFVDLDLLYSGYVESGMIQKKKNVVVFCPNKINWKEKVSEIITKISEKKNLVIIDSINGVYNMFDDLESAIFVNSCIMLLASIGKQVGSSVIVTASARKKENNEWILSPGGKHIIKSEKTGIYFLKKVENAIIINNIEKTVGSLKVFKIE